jgi:hypothetical protein
MGYRVSWDVQGARCIYSSNTTVSDAIHALSEIHSLPAFPVFKYLIHDFGASTQIAPGVSATITIASRGLNSGAPNHKLRTAIVTSDIDFNGMLISMRAHSNFEFEIFPTFSEAEIWASQVATQY